MKILFPYCNCEELGIEFCPVKDEILFGVFITTPHKRAQWALEPLWIVDGFRFVSQSKLQQINAF